MKPHIALIATLLMLCTPLAAIASSVKPMDLDAIIDGAATVFQGRCIETHSERDANGMIVSYATFEVIDRIKGDTGATHTIKQIGGRLPDAVFKVDGIPTFTPGEEYVLFLYGKSSAGFSSPVGLGQGKFSVEQEPMGHSVGNGRDFREMLPGAPTGVQLPPSVRVQLQMPPGQLRKMDLEEFKQFVRARTGR